MDPVVGRDNGDLLIRARSLGLSDREPVFVYEATLTTIRRNQRGESCFRSSSTPRSLESARKLSNLCHFHAAPGTKHMSGG